MKMIIYLSSLSLEGKIRYVYPNFAFNFALKHAVIDNYIIKLLILNRPRHGPQLNISHSLEDMAMWKKQFRFDKYPKYIRQEVEISVDNYSDELCDTQI